MKSRKMSSTTLLSDGTCAKLASGEVTGLRDAAVDLSQCDSFRGLAEAVLPPSQPSSERLLEELSEHTGGMATKGPDGSLLLRNNDLLVFGCGYHCVKKIFVNENGGAYQTMHVLCSLACSCPVAVDDDGYLDVPSWIKRKMLMRQALVHKKEDTVYYVDEFLSTAYYNWRYPPESMQHKVTDCQSLCIGTLRELASSGDVDRMGSTHGCMLFCGTEEGSVYGRVVAAVIFDARPTFLHPVTPFHLYSMAANGYKSPSLDEACHEFHMTNVVSSLLLSTNCQGGAEFIHSLYLQEYQAAIDAIPLDVASQSLKDMLKELTKNPYSSIYQGERSRFMEFQLPILKRYIIEEGWMDHVCRPKALAFMGCLHARLGQGTWLSSLDHFLVRTIAEMAVRSEMEEEEKAVQWKVSFVFEYIYT